MSLVLTQIKTTETKWVVPHSTLEDLTVDNIFHVNIDKVKVRGEEVAAPCIHVEERREYTLQEEEDAPQPYPQDDDVLLKCIHTLISSTVNMSDREGTFRTLTELQHWIEGKKMDIAFELQTFTNV